MFGCVYLHLYLSGSGRASQETAISGSCQWDGSLGRAVSGWPFLQSLLHFLSLHFL
ncbi:hypothetical protein T4D_13543 [Trichinella pseudospiralis]|uniref:Uncharacterized protein n=1 Tax=Trichinella pseudospiralis TaxID=6337 RepID=A0A0V1DQM0_TRIPS|nr:hypothetical protein T4D_13543 [Trichinella pseudospiralis]